MNFAERLQRGVRTGSPEETRQIAAELAAVLPPDRALALHGDLGVGKTTFVQGLARAWGIVGPVTSPTYTIFTLHRGSRLLVHLDAYRLDSPGQMEALLLEEFLISPYCLAIEWPEKIAAWLPPDAWHLDLGIAASGDHSIQLRPR
jgi:tRNA threonylcarbamoyladenosine biosynthesis protein TsaE